MYQKGGPVDDEDDDDNELLVRASAVLKSQGPENQSGNFFGFIPFWPGWEIGFFLTREGFFRASARTFFFWCFFGVFWCFCCFLVANYDDGF